MTRITQIPAMTAEVQGASVEKIATAVLIVYATYVPISMRLIHLVQLLALLV